MICSGVCRLLPIADLPGPATRCRILTSALVSFQGVTSAELGAKPGRPYISCGRSSFGPGPIRGVDRTLHASQPPCVHHPASPDSKCRAPLTHRFPAPAGRRGARSSPRGTDTPGLRRSRSSSCSVRSRSPRSKLPATGTAAPTALPPRPSQRESTPHRWSTACWTTLPGREGRPCRASSSGSPPTASPPRSPPRCVSSSTLMRSTSESGSTTPSLHRSSMAKPSATRSSRTQTPWCSFSIRSGTSRTASCSALILLGSNTTVSSPTRDKVEGASAAVVVVGSVSARLAVHSGGSTSTGTEAGR